MFDWFYFSFHLSHVTFTNNSSRACWGERTGCESNPEEFWLRIVTYWWNWSLNSVLQELLHLDWCGQLCWNLGRESGTGDPGKSEFSLSRAADCRTKLKVFSGRRRFLLALFLEEELYFLGWDVLISIRFFLAFLPRGWALTQAEV